MALPLMERLGKRRTSAAPDPNTITLVLDEGWNPPARDLAEPDAGGDAAMWPVSPEHRARQRAFLLSLTHPPTIAHPTEATPITFDLDLEQALAEHRLRMQESLNFYNWTGIPFTGNVPSSWDAP